jgi:hypothetical protein
VSKQEKSVLIYRAAALVQSASDIDNRASDCGSIRARNICTKIADKLRDDAVALRNKADAFDAKGDAEPPVATMADLGMILDPDSD